MNIRAATILLPLAAFLGCGVPSSPAPTTSSLNITGDWVALALPNPSTPTVLPTPVADFFGALQSSGSSVTGTLHAISLSMPQCVELTQDLPATGTIDANNNLKLTVPLSGGTATITATISTPESYTAGNWQITGGSCAMASTSINIAEFAPAIGTYTGIANVLNLTTGQPIAGTTTNITTTLTQSTAPTADGQFLLTGTVTATGACSGTFPLSNEAVGGGVFMPVFPTLADPGMFLAGGFPPTATLISVAFVPGSACGSQIYSGTLTRQ